MLVAVTRRRTGWTLRRLLKRLRTLDDYSRYVVHWALLTSTREALEEVELQTLGRARALIGCWVEHYNSERLHAALCYLPPEEYYRGDPEARLEERREKLERARERREQINRGRLQAAA